MLSPRHRQSRRPGLTFIAWGAVAGRSGEIASALDGEALALYPPTGGRRPPAVVRYVLSSMRTVAYLARVRPRAVVVTNPPIFPGLIVWSYARLRGAGSVAVVLDSHPGAFGLQGDALAARMLRVHAFLAKRVRAVMVTSEELAGVVSGWGGRGVVVHEAPGGWIPAPPRQLGERPEVLVVSRFAGDEPMEAVVDAARLLPALDVAITGRLADIPAGLAEAAPGNVRFVGFMAADAYRQAVERASVIVTLTTEPTSVMRAAYEAVYAGKVLVLSDWPVSRRLFPSAVAVANEAGALAKGIEDAVSRHVELTKAAAAARSAQLERWDGQLRELREVLGLATPGKG